MRGSTGCFPGTFDPPTLAHLAIAEAAAAAAGLARVDFVLSRDPLAKPRATPVDARAAVLRAVAAGRRWMGVRVVDARLIVDVAAGYDAVVLGADKWLQVNDPSWYEGSVAARDRALAALPARVLVVPRAGLAVPPGAEVLRIDGDHAGVSSTGARAGRTDWMLPEAARAGLWSRDPGG